jgi:hypothetical protein
MSKWTKLKEYVDSTEYGGVCRLQLSLEEWESIIKIIDAVKEYSSIGHGKWCTYERWKNKKCECGFGQIHSGLEELGVLEEELDPYSEEVDD